MSNKPKYSLLAELFEYPKNDFGKKVLEVQQYLSQNFHEAGKLLLPFTQFASKATLKEQEELYTRSFDVQAITTLDIGYIMFGDDYKRAEILVNLNREHREAGNNCGTELSDHLTNVLRLLDKAREKDFIPQFIELVLGPAILKMRGEFSPEKLQMKNKVYLKHHKTIIEFSKEYGTLYQSVLDALYYILKNDFGLKEKTQTEQTADFLKSVGTEMEIEKEN